MSMQNNPQANRGAMGGPGAVRGPIQWAVPTQEQ